MTAPNDAWEYAISMSGQNATLYRTQGSGAYGVVQTFLVVIQGSSWSVDIPRDIIRGSPKRWGYQVLVMTGDPQNSATKATLSDFIDPLEISQKDLWQDLSSGKRNDIPLRSSPAGNNPPPLPSFGHLLPIMEKARHALALAL